MAMTFGTLDFAVAFNRQTAFPLDAKSYFESLTVAQAAAATAQEAGSSETTYYFGQTIAVVEGGKATLYVIQPDKTLKEVGGNILINENVFAKDENGVLNLLGFADAVGGAQLVKTEDGKISWVKPDTTTVEGLSTAIESLKTVVGDDKGGLVKQVADNKAAITKLNGTSAVEGSVDKKVADAINEFATKVSDDQTVNTFKELIDYAASHQGEYSTLSGEVQANKTAIATLNGKDNEAGSVAKTVKDAVEAAQATLQGNIDKKVDKVEGKGLSTNDYTTDEKTKLEGIADGAQVNVIETVKVNGVALTPADKAVDVTVPTGALADKNEVAKADLAADLKTEIEGKVNSAGCGDIISHNVSEFAAAGHNHDTVYSKLDHNHKIEALEQTDYIIFDCGSASTVISTPTV